MKKTLDKKLALKLINQYADNYKRLEEENVSLLKEIADLKLTLTVNKEIIDKLMKENTLDVKIRVLLTNTKEELNILNSRNIQLSKENTYLRSRALKDDGLINNYIAYYKESNDNLEKKVFILDNMIKKKDNMINLLNKKLKVSYDSFLRNPSEVHEVYVCEPNESLTIMFDDLLLYKKAYENALLKIKEGKSECNKLQKRIDTQHDIMIKENDIKESIEGLHEMSLKCNRKSWETDEWIAILCFLNITKEDIEKHLSNNKFFNKIFEGIELLNKLVVQRNDQLTQLKKDIQMIKDMNISLRNENIDQTKNIVLLKNTISELKQSKGKLQERNDDSYSNNNLSMINNSNINDKSINGRNQTIGINGNNQSLTLERSFVQQEQFSKNYAFTQVTENSFDIIDENMFDRIQRKQLKIMTNGIESHPIENSRTDI